MLRSRGAGSKGSGHPAFAGRAFFALASLRDLYIVAQAILPALSDFSPHPASC
jgi:hypothetical protein